MKKIILLALLFMSLGLSAQISKYNVLGTIQDSTHTPLIGATAVLLSPIDSTMAGFAISNTDGEFELDRIDPGNYNLQITYIGYGTFERPIEVGGAEKDFDLGEIFLAGQTNMLDVIEVKAAFIPMVIKKDTVEYNADAFKVRPNANVEELLKKLPGVEVDIEGNITAQGEEVGRVTVDGKRFFGDDVLMATRNLPAASVKKVQVLNKKSESAEFSGIDDGETTKVINLELKEDSKVGLFGNVEAGYGTDDRYMSKFSANKFGSKFQLATLVAFNNINQQGFSFGDYNTLTGGGGRGNAIQSGILNNGGGNNGQTQSLTGGLNFNYDFTKKIKVNTSYFLTYVDRNFIQNSSRENFIPQTYFVLSDVNNTNSNLAHNVNTRFEAELDSIQRIDLQLRYSLNNSDQNSNSFTKTLNEFRNNRNDVDQTNIGDASSQDVSLNLEYDLKLGKDGRILTLEADLGNTDTDDEALLDRENTLYDDMSASIDTILQDQISRIDNKNYTLSANYKEPLGNKNYMDLRYEQSNYNSDRIKDFFNLDPGNRTIRDFDELLSSNFNNDIVYNRLGLGWTKNHDKFTVVSRLVYQRSELTGGVSADSKISRPYNYFLPNLTFNFNKPNIRLRYRTSVNEPSVDQLQPIVDNTNPNNVYAGNPDLKPEYTHNVSVRYFFFDRFNFRNIFANVDYRHTEDNIVNSQVVDENFNRTTTPINVKNNRRVSGRIGFGTPIKPLRIKTSINTGMTYSNGINFVNGIENTVKSSSPNLRLEFENLNNEFATIVIYGNMNYTTNKYSSNTNLNGKFLNQQYGTSFFAELGKGFGVNTTLDYSIFDKERYGDDNEIVRWNANVSKRVKNDRLTLKLTAFDILNQNRGIVSNTGDTFIEDVITNSIGRYFMFSALYKLTSFNPESRGGRGFGRRR